MWSEDIAPLPPQVVSTLDSDNTQPQHTHYSCIALLTGSLIFHADLVRQLSVPTIFETVKLSSYGEGTTSSRNVKISKDLDRSIEGKRVLIIEDIIDTGNTLAWFNKHLESKGATSTEIVCLLNKQCRREVDVAVE